MKTLFSLFIYAAGLTTTVGQGITNEIMRMQNEQRKEQMQRELREKDVSITFYGVIRDQSGNPIPSATVNMSVKQYDYAVGMGIKQFQTTSTNDGTFKVLGERGWTLYVDGIEKEGYEYSYSASQTNSFNYPRVGSDPSPDNPAVFIVRKKEPPTLVIPGDFFPQLKYSDDIRAVDLIRQKVWGVGPDAKREYPEFTPDIYITVRMNEAEDGCVVTVSVPSSTGGILMSDDIMYVAPEDGYQPKVEMPFPMGARNQAKRFYIKSREGQVYARIDANIMVYPERLFFRMNSWANPDGKRNIDFDEALYREYKLQQIR